MKVHKYLSNHVKRIFKAGISKKYPAEAHKVESEKGSNKIWNLNTKSRNDQ
jgi:hypothetical protein